MKNIVRKEKSAGSKHFFPSQWFYFIGQNEFICANFTLSSAGVSGEMLEKIKWQLNGLVKAAVQNNV